MNETQECVVIGREALIEAIASTKPDYSHMLLVIANDGASTAHVVCGNTAAENDVPCMTVGSFELAVPSHRIEEFEAALSEADGTNVIVAKHAEPLVSVACEWGVAATVQLDH